MQHLMYLRLGNRTGGGGAKPQTKQRRPKNPDYHEADQHILNTPATAQTPRPFLAQSSPFFVMRAFVQAVQIQFAKLSGFVVCEISLKKLRAISPCVYFVKEVASQSATGRWQGGCLISIERSQLALGGK